MNGPEHYLEAERLLEQAEIDSRVPQRLYVEDANVLAAAQVHATLALAAATAYPAIRDWLGDEARDGADWSRITAPTPASEPGHCTCGLPGCSDCPAKAVS